MKTNLLRLTLLLGATIVFFASCSRIDDDNNPSARSNTVVPIPFFVMNAEGAMPNSPSDLLYEVRGANPVMKPDGSQITWGEFANISGEIYVECQEDGVEAYVEITGLIPNGVYTMWNVVFDAPGMDPTDPMLGLEGLGAAGIGDGSDNAFTATASGEGSIRLRSPGGPLSMVSNTDLANCPLTGNFEWHVVGAYHIDGQTYGPYLGPDGTAIEHFGFIFRSEE